MTLICLGLKHLENSWRCYLAPIANYSILCYETVLSANSYPSLASCLLAAVTANRLLFRYDFLNLFSYLFQIKLLHFRDSKTLFRFSIHHQPTAGENVAYSTRSNSLPNVENLWQSGSVYCLSEKTMSLCALCSSAAAAVAVCQLQFQLSQYRLYCSQKCDFRGGLEGASEKNFLGSLSLAIFYGTLINYSIIRPLINKISSVYCTCS